MIFLHNIRWAGHVSQATAEKCQRQKDPANIYSVIQYTRGQTAREHAGPESAYIWLRPRFFAFSRRVTVNGMSLLHGFLAPISCSHACF